MDRLVKHVPRLEATDTDCTKAEPTQTSFYEFTKQRERPLGRFLHTTEVQIT